jgi:tetratricopeptide (TPR) repeat protein
MRDHPVEGLVEWQKSHSLFQAVAQADRSDLESQRELGRSCINVGAQYRYTDQWSEALEYYKTGLEVFKQLTEANPSVTDFQEKFAFVHFMAGEALENLHRPAEAKIAWERSRDLYVRLVETNQEVPTYQSCLADTYDGLADLARAAGRMNEARTLYGRANVIHKALVKKYDKDAVWKIGLAFNLRRRGLLDFADSRFADAAAVNRRAAKLLEPFQKVWFENTFELACCHAMQAALAGKAGSEVPADAGPDEADKAMDLLRQSVAAGYRNLHKLRTDAGLNLLRQRDDFKKLLAGLEEKTKAPPAGKVK